MIGGNGRTSCSTITGSKGDPPLGGCEDRNPHSTPSIDGEKVVDVRSCRVGNATVLIMRRMAPDVY